MSEGLLSSFGQGLSAAGAILSDRVYDTQAAERKEILPNMMRALEIKKAQAALRADEDYAAAIREASAGLQPSALNNSAAMLDLHSKIPMDLLANSPRAQQTFQLIGKQQAREDAAAAAKAAVEAKKEAATARATEHFEKMEQRRLEFERDAERKELSERDRAEARLRAIEARESMNKFMQWSVSQGLEIRREAAASRPRNLQLTTDVEGNQLIVDPDGTTRPLTREDGTGIKKPVKEDKPMTEFQGKAALYGSRSAQSDKVLKSLEDKINTTGLAMGQATGVVGNAMMSSEQQRVSQAQRDFVNAVLRQESGAVISDAEFDNAKKQYFPTPGDTPQVVAQKRANRKLAIDGFKRMAGPKGAVDIDAIIKEPLLPGVPAITPTPQQAGGKVGNTRLKFDAQGNQVQ